MSEPKPQTLPVIWPRDARPPAVPVRAPARRHEPPTGLVAFDWDLRHAFALRRERRLLAAFDDPGALPATGVPGDVDPLAVRAALARLEGPAAPASDVLALLRGCYVVLPAEERLTAVARAAAVAMLCGIGVHAVCERAEQVPALVDAIRAQLPEALRAGVAGARDGAADPAALLQPAPVVCGALNAFAHAWLRLGGDRPATLRAAGWLGGDERAAFPFAALLLLLDGDTQLLDLQRHPLQVTGQDVDDATRLMLEVLAFVADWKPGEQFADDTTTPAGAALLETAIAERGGLWAVPRELSLTLRAALTLSRLEDARDYRYESGRLTWLPAAAAFADELRSKVELALRCRHDPSALRRVRRRAWFLDFLAGYARLGATGDNLADEWRDLWQLHGTPVLRNVPRALTVEWRPEKAAELAVDAAATAIAGHALMLGEDLLPTGTPCLETADGRAAAQAVLAGGKPLRIVGAPGALRHVPAGVSVIMLPADDPGVPAALGRLARRALRWGRPGRWLAQALGVWALRAAAARRRRLRQQLLQRRLQERRTYAFTGFLQDDR